MWDWLERRQKRQFELPQCAEYCARALYVCVGCILLAGSLAAQNIYVPANDVSFGISTDHSSYRTQEQITVRWRIENVSNRTLYVPKRQWETARPSSDGKSIVHVDAWFKNAAGKEFRSGWVGSGDERPTFSERMREASVLLRPGEHFDGTITLNPGLFGLPPGAYRIEAVLNGWKDDQFTEAQRTELSKMGNPFVRGEVSATTTISLRP
jgi:hypothetical protein